jgi:hypothetical protein
MKNRAILKAKSVQKRFDRVQLTCYCSFEDKKCLKKSAKEVGKKWLNA